MRKWATKVANIHLIFCWWETFSAAVEPLENIWIAFKTSQLLFKAEMLNKKTGKEMINSWHEAAVYKEIYKTAFKYLALSYIFSSKLNA